MRALKYVTIGIMLLVLAGIVFLASLIGYEEKECALIPGGPFLTRFHGELYGYSEEDMEVWFREQLGQLSSTEEARKKLAASFTVDLTRHREVTIDRLEKFPAGGQWIKVRLRFLPDGRFQDAEVEVYCVWM